MKTCTKCLISQDIANFSKRSRNKDGLQPVCKTCSKAVNASYYGRETSDKLLKKRSENIRSFADEFPYLASHWSDRNTLSPHEVSSTSYGKAFFTCDNGHVSEHRINSVSKRGDILDSLCSECKSVKNSFAEALPDYVSWWADDKPVDRVARFSRAVASFVCDAGHSFDMPVRDFTGSCKACNSIGYKFPELMQEWDSSNKLSPYEVSYNSASRAAWKCVSCGYIWSTCVYQRANLKTGCPECSLRISSSSGETELAKWVQSILPTERQESSYRERVRYSHP